ncbi:MAG: SLC13 family permease [Phycisphaerae bacterium]
MGWEAWLTLSVVVLAVGVLALTRVAADIVLVGAVALLLAAGVVTPTEALSGLSNPGVITVGVLLVVVAGIQRTGAVAWIGSKLLGRPKSQLAAQLRVMGPVAVMSAFLNNTPVVAMFISAVTDWSRKLRLPASKLLIPLSYAAILGGTCTLIGTSTNLVINGLLMSEAGRDSLGMFEISVLGLPCAAVGFTFLVLVGRRFLPDRRPAISVGDDPRNYTIEMIVEPDGPLVGKTIEQAGLRQLEGLYLMEIDRDGDIIPAVGPEEKLQSGDRLVFVGIVESVAELRKTKGLKPATDQTFKLDTPAGNRCLIEAVVSDTCPLVGRSIREGRFRGVYNAVVIAVARTGRRVRKKVGDIVLQPGDTLLLEAHPSFVEQQRNSRDFYLVGAVQDSSPPRHEKAPLAMGILAAMVTVVALGWVQMLTAAMLAAGLLIITRCLHGSEARRSVDWHVLIAIAAAFGVGRAISESGLAGHFTASILSAIGDRPWLALAAVAGLASVLNGVVTSNATAVLVFPLAMRTAAELDVNIMPFALAVMMASAGSFATPLGYQTNLMVYGPGGYRFTDYLRMGVPMNALIWATAVALAPVIWPF